jgi:pyruvate ferredoxin oxidoreductase delta subunit
MADDALVCWEDLEQGAVICDAGCACKMKTGDWKTNMPVVDRELCNKCGLCAVYCPEFCVAEEEEGFFKADLEYCKGCGICANECPKKAISMVREEE